jgi:hypothetical protein
MSGTSVALSLLGPKPVKLLSNLWDPRDILRMLIYLSNLTSELRPDISGCWNR